MDYISPCDFSADIDGVKSGCQVVFIPALSLFMLTRLIAGNRVITLGTAIEQHFLVTQDWGMGATIAVFLNHYYGHYYDCDRTAESEGYR